MKLPPHEFKIVFSAEEIAERVAELGREVVKAYKGEPIICVCVLKGAFMFFADLMRHLAPLTPQLDFVRLASYGSETATTGRVFFSKDMEVEVEGSHVLIVEDIVDTGHSMRYLLKVLSSRGAKSVAVCTLVSKSERREVEVPVDFTGFHLEKGFVVGYGLDYAEQYRELPGIYEVIFTE